LIALGAGAMSINSLLLNRTFKGQSRTRIRPFDGLDDSTPGTKIHLE